MYMLWLISDTEEEKIILQLDSKFIVTVTEGDLFKFEGVIVIPVNEYFDTIVNDIIIAKILYMVNL